MHIRKKSLFCQLSSEILLFVSTNTSGQFQSQFMSTVLQNAVLCLVTDISVNDWLIGAFYLPLYKLQQISTVIPRLTSDRVNELLSYQRFFFAVFRTRLTNVLVDARPNIKQKTWAVGPFQGLTFSVCMIVTKNFPFSFIQLVSCSSQPLVILCPFIVCILLFYKTYL